MSSERLSLGVLVRERVKLFCEWQCVNVVSLGLVGAIGSVVANESRHQRRLRLV